MKNIASLFVAAVILLSPLMCSAESKAPSITSYPVLYKIPYGATSHKVSITFDIVSNASQQIVLTNPQLLKTKSGVKTEGAIKIQSVVFKNGSKECSISGAGRCQVEVTLLATGTQPYGGTPLPEAYALQVDYAVPGQRPATINSKDTVFDFADGQYRSVDSRTLTIINQCNYPVWLGMISDAAPNMKSVQAQDNSDGGRSGAQTSCQSNADCIPGSSCSTTSQSPQCYWDTPIPNSKTYYLGANGGATTVAIPVYDVGNGSYNDAGKFVPSQMIWSGTIAGRVRCNSQNCELADCGNGAGACQPGGRFTSPVTTARMTLLRNSNIIMSNESAPNNSDTYFVSVADGVIVPTSVEPVNGVWGGKSAPYVCGPAGGIQAKSPLKPCSWNMNPPSAAYNFVRYNPGAQRCESKADCTNGTGMACGLTIKPGTGGIGQQCGLPVPYYWTQNLVCNAGVGSPYFSALFHCEKQATKATDPDLKWLVDACPLVQVLPGSTDNIFTCQTSNYDQVNVTNYRITFCPGGAGVSPYNYY